MIPKDPFMLLSYVNTQLRDFYPDLDQMCQALGLEKKNWKTNWPVLITATTKQQISLYKLL